MNLVVVDSVAALTPKSELEGDMGDSSVGVQARLMSQAMRKLTGSISKSNCMVIFINQIRMKIGVMFGSPETTTGGNALKFYSSVRLDIRRIGAVKDRDEIVGNSTRVKVSKTKLHLRSSRLNSTSCMAKAFPKRVKLLIWASKRASSINRVRGTATAMSALVRDVKTLKPTSRKTHACALR